MRVHTVPKPLAILLSDIVKFTPLAETMPDLALADWTTTIRMKWPEAVRCVSRASARALGSMNTLSVRQFPVLASVDAAGQRSM